MNENTPFARQAAKASWLAPFIAIVMGFFGNALANSNPDGPSSRTVSLVVGALALIIVLAGLILGVLALFGIKKHGARGILVPAIVGIVLSSGYLYLLISAILIVRRIVEERGPSL